jgi:hypothetical protein
VIERETGLEQMAETGVMIHGDLSADLLRTIFSPRSPLHDGAVLVRNARVLAAGAVLPLGETTMHSERFGTRHRAALGTTEQTDAIVVVVSEENGQISLVERARIRRNLNESQLARAIRTALEPPADRTRLRQLAAVPAGGTTRFAELRQAVRRERAAQEPLPADEPMQRPIEPIEPIDPTDGSTGGPTDDSTEGERLPANAPPAPVRAEDREPAGTRGRAG